jgi:hypothetical protein
MAIAIKENYLTKVVENFVHGFNTGLKALMIGWMVGRAKMANRQIAQHILHDYPDHTLSSLTSQLNYDVEKAIRGEFNDK